jgi:hypothetical protein
LWPVVAVEQVDSPSVSGFGLPEVVAHVVGVWVDAWVMGAESDQPIAAENREDVGDGLSVRVPEAFRVDHAG